MVGRGRLLLSLFAAVASPLVNAFVGSMGGLRALPEISGVRTRHHSIVRMQATAYKPKVIIAGGGLGGLVLANALQRHNIPFDLYERTAEYKPFGGPIQVQSNALAALEAINKDMVEEILAAGTTTGNRVNGLKDGVTNTWYCQFDTGAPAKKRGLPLTRVVDRPDLQNILLKYVDRSRIHTGVEVEGYTEQDGKVFAKLSSGETVTGDVLVGADGIWSEVRAQLHGRPAGKESAQYSGYTCFTGVCLARPEDVNEVAYKVYLSKGQYFVCSDVGRGRMQWYAMIGQEPGIKVQGSPNKYLVDRYKGWSREVTELLEITTDDNITQRDLYDRAPALLAGWSKAHVTVLGDAAHPMMPNLGQGACQAFEDAYRLAKELDRVSDNGDVSFALKVYENIRLARSSAVHGLARIASDVLFYSGVLFQNKAIQLVVSTMMQISMPLILDFLYQNVLDDEDKKFTEGRLKDRAVYEEKSGLYKSVVEAQQALNRKEKAKMLA